MTEILNGLERFFSTNIFGTLSLYDVISTGLKYIFVFIIYYFIFHIIRLIYLDIRTIDRDETPSEVYLRLITRPETLNFKVNEIYYLNPQNSIGRGDENSIVLKDRFISKLHAKIAEQRGAYVLEDLKSANGTFVNDRRILQPTRLNNRDVVRLGDVELLFVNEVHDHDD